VNVDDCCRFIYSETFGDQMGFSEYVAYLADHYQRDRKIAVAPSAACGGCEFKATEADLSAGLKCGFRECWKESLGWEDQDFDEPNIFEIWDFRKKSKYIEAGMIKLAQIQEDDIVPRGDKKPGLSRTQRQWLQVQKVQQRDNSSWIDRDNLDREMSAWIYPLHFIDFETAMAAIPFNKNQRPYEGIVFQFSLPLKSMPTAGLNTSGQYLNTAPGFFPVTYDFIRSLKRELETDSGSIFRYAAHENTYLNLIYRQLRQDRGQIPDRDELCAFIRTITRSAQNSPEKWEGERNMIDMLELVKRYYYDPAMKRVQFD